MAGKLKRPYLKKYFPFGRGVRSNISNRKGSVEHNECENIGLQPLKKAMLEEAVKKIVGKSSRSMIAHSARQRNCSIENSLSPDDLLPDKMFEHRHHEHIAGRKSFRILHTQHKKKGQLKNVAEFPGTSKYPEVANAKNTENRGMEYMEYAVAVTSHWDKEFVHKFSTKNYLLETQCQLQDIYCRKKLFASLKRQQRLGMREEASQVQPDHPFSAEQEQISRSPLLSDSPSLIFSPQIPPSTPILDPLQYLRKVFPKSEDKTPHLLQKNIPSEYLPAQSAEVGLRQQMLDNIQQHGHDGNKSTSLEPYSAIPLLPLHPLNADMFDPGASVKIHRAAGLYVPCKFSLSMDTADVNFKYYPHTF